MYHLRFPITEIQGESLETYCLEEENFHWSQYFDNVSKTLVAHGYFPQKKEAEEQGPIIASLLSLEILPEISEIDDEDWQLAYRKYLTPWHYQSLHWVPQWQRNDYPLPEQHSALYYDAGMAFGTGSHETTRLCGQRLWHFCQERSDRLAEQRIIDAGCGSGILAISALLLGAGQVSGFDLDPEAIPVCQENLQRNHLAKDSIAFHVADIEQGLSEQKADLILANIRTPALIAEASTLLEALAPQAWLVLSGILLTEKEEIVAAFTPLAQAIDAQVTIDSHSMGEWIDLCICRSN